MHSYVEVLTAEDMEELIRSIAGFHDSLTKEIRVANRGWIDSSHSMILSHRFDVQVLIQSQWSPYARELVYIDVSTLSLGSPNEYWSGGGTVGKASGPVDRLVIDMSFDDQLKISAQRLFYRDRPTGLGQTKHFRGEVPAPEAVSASRLDGNWRQCSGCADAWEENRAIEYSYCPACSRLTWTPELAQEGDGPAQ